MAMCGLVCARGPDKPDGGMIVAVEWVEMSGACVGGICDIISLGIIGGSTVPGIGGDAIFCKGKKRVEKKVD